MKHRLGYTLVELLMTLTVGSTLLVLAIGMVHKSMLISESTQRRCEQLLATDRFVEQFRNDLHYGKQVDCDSASELSVVCGDNSKIAYRAEANRITREQSLDTNQIRREELVLDDNSFGQFKKHSQSNITGLTIRSNIDLCDTETRIERNIEAVIGLLRSNLEIAESTP